MNLLIAKMNINTKNSVNSIRNLELVTAARSGNGKAQTQLKEHYMDAIFYMLLKMVNNRAEAEALAIKSFENAFTNIHQCNPEYPISIWLFRIASNYAIAHLRDKKAIDIAQKILDNPELSIIKVVKREESL